MNPERATAVFDDSGWFKQAGILGLYALIPVVGPIVIMGWGLERYIQSRTEPSSLGPVSFDRDLAAGQTTAPGILGLPAALMALNGLRRMAVTFAFFAMRILEGDLAPETAAVLYEFIFGASELTSSLVTLLWLPWVLLLPELMRRVYQGELFPWKNPGPSLVAITTNQQAYLKVVVATTLTLGALWMVSGVFGWLWLILAPLAWAVVANFAAQWQGMVEDLGAEGTV
ncbi:MAG: hypothetical protein ACI9VR_002531 [Cognaticolwellia sp.]